MAPSKPKLKQAEFDEAVQTNIEDFDMPPGEAVQSAVQEFELQGYDLSAIIKAVPGSAAAEQHPVAVACRALSEVVDGSPGVSGAALPDLTARLTALQKELSGLSKDQQQQALAVAAKDGAVPTLVACCRGLQARAEEEGPAAADAASSLVQALQLLARLMPSPDCRGQLAEAGGVDLLAALLAAGGGGSAGVGSSSSSGLLAAVARLAEAAANKDEDNKCRLVDGGIVAALTAALASGGEGVTPPAAVAICGVIRSVTSADDPRPPSSKAFMHARLLAKNDKVPLVLLAALRGPLGSNAATAGALLVAMRQIAANDDICKELSEAGGVATCLGQLEGAAVGGPPELARAAAGCLRQLANNDGIKAALAEQGALGTLVRLLRTYEAAPPDLMEQVLGLLVAMTLRQPDIAAAAADAGAVEALLEVLEVGGTRLASAKGNGAATASKAPVSSSAAADDTVGGDEAAAQVFGASGGGGNGVPAGVAAKRQACMAVRNMVVRNPELRPAFLAKGAEGLLRGVRAGLPAGDRDVATAALRDLGVDQYNE